MASSTAGNGKGPRMMIEAPSTASQPESTESSQPSAPQVRPKVEAAPKTEAKSAPKAPAPKVEAAPAPVPKMEAEPKPAPAPAPKAPAQKAPTPQAKAPRPTIVVSNDVPNTAESPDEPIAQEYANAAAYEWEEPEAQQTNTQVGGQPQAEQDTQAKGTSQGPTFKDAKRAASGWVHRTFPGHEYAFYGAIVAIVLALLVFAVGFARMLFVCVLIVVGIAVGQIFDGDPKIIRAIRNLFSNEREQR